MDKQTISYAKLVPCGIIFISLLFTPIHSNHLLSLCQNNTGISNPVFDQNIKLLLKSLASNTPSSHGFFNTSVGDNPDNKVNGQALCRGDVNATVCRQCLKQASKDIRQCETREAIVWYEACQMHYASREFFGMIEYAGQEPDKLSYRRRNMSPDKRFQERLHQLFDKLLKDANLSNPNTMFATATANYKYSRDGVIYGLVQCTRDIDVRKCKTCLECALGDLYRRFSTKEGGIMLSGSCNVRFEVFAFYKTSRSDGRKRNKWKIGAVASVAASSVVISICSLFGYLLMKKGSRQEERVLWHSTPSPRATTIAINDDELFNTEEFLVMDFASISTATNEFSNLNKLGHGGFGSVYKGVLPNGKEIAVKRLSRKSWQGLGEFKNELVLIAKLQHRNLVRLVGFAMEDEEKLLVYEFMPNKSLDSFIFDSGKRSLLDWKIRYNIICGIARGLLYLHEDSRLKIIHRDLKPSNVLLDAEMVAKISDFGLARIFCEDQNTASTKKVVGTYGYMAPEYAMEGQFSVKSDVFSFGVILLEIISGRKNNSVKNSQPLIRYTWQLWREGKQLEFLDPLMKESNSVEEINKCIQIGLLCVQADPAERPTMSSVVILVEGGLASLPQPSQPAFCAHRAAPISQSSLTNKSLSGLIASATISSSSSSTQ